MQTIRKTIAVSVTLVRDAEEQAAKLGMDFSDYVRYLLAREKEQRMKQEPEPVYYMSERTEKNVERARKEIAAGRAKKFDKVDDLMDYINSFDKKREKTWKKSTASSSKKERR